MVFTGKMIAGWCKKEKIPCKKISPGRWEVEYRNLEMYLSIADRGRILSVTVPLIRVPAHMEIPGKVFSNLLVLHLDALKIARFAFHENFFLLTVDLSVPKQDLFKEYIKLAVRATKNYLPFVIKLIYDDDFDPIGTRSRKDAAKAPPKAKKVPGEISDEEYKKRLGSLKSDLKQVVTGQDSVIEEIVKNLKGALLGVKIRSRRPKGVFLFMGPRGVGKTEMAFKIAALLFHHDIERYVKLDPSVVPDEIMPDRIIRKPFCLILLDEIEKAKGDVRDFYISALQDGSFYDKKGRRVDLTRAIVIMTANISWKGREIGFAVSKKEKLPGRAGLVDVLRRDGFSDPLIDSIDEVIHFRELTVGDIKKIMREDLKRYAETLRKEGKELLYSDELFEILAEKVDLEFGINSALRVLNRYIYNQVIPADDFKGIKKVEIQVKEKNKKEITLESDKDNKRFKVILHIK